MLFYPKVMLVGLLPWTPLLLGRLFDAGRGLRISTPERLLWSWAAVVVGFFTVSGFKLDHYVFPAAPALCILCAHAWDTARTAEKQPLGIVVGLALIPLLLVAAGIVLIPGLNRVPLELPAAARLLPIALIASGIAMMAQVARRGRPAPVPFAAVAGLLASYAMVLTIGLPAFEQMKPTRRLAKIVATQATADDHVGMFRLNRWSSSWRFYVGRHSERLETADQLRAFLARPGRHYCAMLRRDYDRLTAEGFRLRIVHQEPGFVHHDGPVPAVRRPLAATRSLLSRRSRLLPELESCALPVLVSGHSQNECDRPAHRTPGVVAFPLELPLRRTPRRTPRARAGDRPRVPDGQRPHRHLRRPDGAGSPLRSSRTRSSSELRCTA